MKTTFFEKILFIAVFLVSLLLYFNAFSVIAYIIFVVVTLGLLFYDIKSVKTFRKKTTWKKVLSIVGILISLLLVLIFSFVVHVYPNLCSFGPNVFAKNYFTGEVKGFYCGITPWYYKKINGQEAKNAELKICNEYVANDPLYQKVKSGSGAFDNLTGNFPKGVESPYLEPTEENTFGIISGTNYGFDFSAGQRTSNLSNADIILENDKIKSISGSSLYLDNTKRILANRGPLQEFHLREAVFDTQPVKEVNLKDFGFAFVKTQEGNFAKVILSTSSVDNRGNTIITIFWAYQPSGTKSLKSDYINFAKELDTYCDRYK